MNMKHKKKKMNEGGLKKVSEIIAGLPAKQSSPSWYSPLSSIAHPDGWKSVVTILIFGKNYNWGEIVEALSTIWPKALAAVGKEDNGKTSPELSKEEPDKEIGICTEQALRRRVREVALDRHHQATVKLGGKLSPVEEKEQREIVEEVERLMKRFEWSLEPASEPVKKPAKRKSAKNHRGEDASDPVASPGVIRAPGSVPQDQGQPAESIPLPAPPTETPDPKVESNSGDAGDGELAPAMADEQKPVEVSRSGEKKSVEKTEITPLCPRCNSPMRIKEAGQGKYKGTKFFGCSAFPKCKATRSVEG